MARLGLDLMGASSDLGSEGVTFVQQYQRSMLSSLRTIDLSRDAVFVPSVSAEAVRIHVSVA